MSETPQDETPVENTPVDSSPESAETQPSDPARGEATADSDAPAEENHPSITDDEATVINERVVETLKTVYDPEIPVDIYQLGMIYEVDVNDTAFTFVKMTLTSPSCPVAGTLPGEVEEKVKKVDGVRDAKIELVWEPPWTPDMMSDAAKLQLNMM